MAQNHGRVDASANSVRQQLPNDIIMSMNRITPVTTAGNATLTATQVLSGIVSRTGPTAAYADAFPDAAAICAACTVLSAGDSFDLTILNTVAFANTPTAGQGIVLAGNTALNASSMRRYLLTCLAAGVASIATVTSTNANPTLANLSDAAIKVIVPGMGVTGTGIPASTTVLAVNSVTNTVTLSAVATATGSLVAATFFPRIQVDGVFSASL